MTLAERCAKECAHRKEIRRLAKEGNPDAMAKVAYYNAAREASKQKALAKGKNYNAEGKARKRREAQENKRKGAAGDTVAQAAYEKYRDQKAGERQRKARRNGVKSLAEYLALVTRPAEEKAAERRAYQRRYNQERKAELSAYYKARRADLKQQAAAGDAAAIAKNEERLSKQRASYARWYAKQKQAA